MHSRIVSLLFISAGWALCWCALGCHDNGNPTQTSMIQPTLSSIQVNIFDKSCASSSCHSSEGQRGGLVLEAGNSYSNLVNALCSNPNAQTLNMRRVVPFKPDSSFILTKLTGPGPNEGSLMPYGSSKLPQEMIDAVRKWIESGAKNN